MTAKQIAGWFLVSAGVLLIAWTLYSSWQIFTGSAKAPEIFSIVPAQAKKQAAGGAQDLQAQELLSQILKEQLQGFFPANSTPKLLNLISWSVLATIFLLGGGQLAGIGVKLLQ